MQSEIIDQLYENEAVEGVAIFNDSGELVENQLALNEEAVIQVCSCLTTIKQGLKGAGRDMKGFVLKTNNYLLQAIVRGDLLILLQLSPGHSTNDTHTKIVSQLGEIKTKPALPTSAKSTVVKTAAEPATAQPAAEEAPVGSMIAWDVFHGSLLTLLKRVAPYSVAKKMVTAAAMEEGVAEGEDQQVSLEQAFKIGQAVVNKIPNASRRQLLQKEYDLMIKQY